MGALASVALHLPALMAEPALTSSSTISLCAWAKGAEVCLLTACISVPTRALLKFGKGQYLPNTTSAGAGNG